MIYFFGIAIKVVYFTVSIYYGMLIYFYMKTLYVLYYKNYSIIKVRIYMLYHIINTYATYGLIILLFYKYK